MKVSSYNYNELNLKEFIVHYMLLQHSVILQDIREAAILQGLQVLIDCTSRSCYACKSKLAIWPQLFVIVYSK